MLMPWPGDPGACTHDGEPGAQNSRGSTGHGYSGVGGDPDSGINQGVSGDSLVRLPRSRTRALALPGRKPEPWAEYWDEGANPRPPHRHPHNASGLEPRALEDGLVETGCVSVKSYTVRSEVSAQGYITLTPTIMHGEGGYGGYTGRTTH